MEHYRYVKMESVTISVPVLPLISIVLGVSMLFWVIWPLLSFQVMYGGKTNTVSPIAEDFVPKVQANELDADYTKASSWFPKNSHIKTVTPVDTYFLTIPKLHMQNAVVKIGTDDLAKNIIHYGGTGLPGKYGNAVLFGHSILPHFYDPKNYLSIFSLIPTLKKGDDIFVRFDGVDYRYEVIEGVVTSPADVSGLEQRYDDSYLTLVTCFPPGLFVKRYWLTAKLRPFGE